MAEAYKLTREKMASITDLEAAFGTTRLLPGMHQIPREFQSHTGYEDIAGSIFYGTPMPPGELKFREGFTSDDVPAFRKCISAHLRSFDPKHEHKMSGVAYMISCVAEFKPDAKADA